MSRHRSDEELIRELTESLEPRRPLASPFVRALCWLSVVLILCMVAFSVWGKRTAGLAAAAPDPFIAAAIGAAMLTAILAAIAAFELSLPDRGKRWLLLPLASLLLWAAVSGAGCLATMGSGGLWGHTLSETLECLGFITGVSVPLSALAIVMLRSARPERWLSVITTAAVASGAAAAAILALVHPHNSTPLDLFIHAIAIVTVVALNAVIGGRLLTTDRLDGR
jgi:hypothetical protein